MIVTGVIIEMLRSLRSADAVLSAVQHHEGDAHLEELLVDLDEHVEDGHGRPGLDAAAVDQRVAAAPFQYLFQIPASLLRRENYRTTYDETYHSGSVLSSIIKDKTKFRTTLTAESNGSIHLNFHINNQGGAISYFH